MKYLALAFVAVAFTLSLSACSSSSSGSNTPQPANVNADITPLIAGGVPPFVRIAKAKSGKQILTDSSGMTLYVLQGDAPVYTGGKCPDSCLTTWVPLLVPVGAVMTPTAGLNGPLGTFRRSGLPEDVRQVLYQGKPLYRYIGDHAPGDTNGAGQENNAWSVAVP